MSEPKTYRIIQGDTGGCGAPSYKCDTNANRIEEWSDDCEVYEKFEADKVIAELNGQIESLRTKLIEQTAQRVLAETQLRRNNYTRCLDNAWWCRKLRNVYALIAYTHRGWKIAGYYDDKAELYRKWNTRWLKIAEQFKEAK